MRKTVTFACVAASVLLLGACSGNKSDSGSVEGNGAASADASSAASPSAPSADAGAPASPKQGLWEMKITAASAPQPQLMTVCVGAPAPGTNGFAPPPSAGQTCTKNAVTKTATGYDIESECTSNGMTMASKGTVSGDFSSDYKIDMSSKISGANIPPAAQQEMKTSIEAHYKGACPADMKPGQVKRG
ncbi:DUF3617 domain-containing protein [Flavisphingomonas formosensis]|uniref:DUF3617 domain-containing protein n=1 Tax=Flavisphingomonas formosensis TaxID=861534 RepID=UPI0018DF8C75|nr:DUF3617 family protein [Sphingomonas formosensis]